MTRKMINRAHIISVWIFLLQLKTRNKILIVRFLGAYLIVQINGDVFWHDQ